MYSNLAKRLLSAITLTALFIISVPASIHAQSFTQQLEPGDRGAAVAQIQEELDERGYFDYSEYTGFYGPVTTKGVQKFQIDCGIVSAGDWRSTGYGRVGPLTLKALANGCDANAVAAVTSDQKIAGLLEQIQALQDRIDVMQSSLPTSTATLPLDLISPLVSGAPRGTTAVLSWNLIADATSYIITRSSEGAEYMEVIATVSSSSYQDRGLTSGEVYTYGVIAVSDNAKSAPSEAVTVSISRGSGGSGNSTPPQDLGDLAAPDISSVTVEMVSATTATITWVTDRDADSQVNYGTTTAYAASSTLDTTLTTSHSVNLTGLISDTKYNFRVRSVDSEGNTAVSSNQTFTTNYFGLSAAAGQNFSSYSSVLSFVADGDDLLIRDANNSENNYSGVPYSEFTEGAGPKFTMDENGLLDDQPYLFQTHATIRSVNMPDGQGGDVGEGFTNTGATWDGSAFWVGNDGGNISGDASRNPSIVRVSLTGEKLNEIDIEALYSDFSSVQGVAYDTSDDSLWVAQISSGEVRHLSPSGVDLADGFPLPGINGLAYDSKRDKLWTLVGTTLTLRQKNGTIDATYATPPLSDQLFYDAERDYIWVTYGANGSIGKADAYNASDGVFVGTATFPDATAIEGIVILNGNFYIFHDGYYHAVDGAVIQENQFQVYPAVLGSANIAWAIDHNPLNGNSVRGYVVESVFDRLNGVPTNFENSQWQKSNITVTEDTITSPTGVNNADLFTATIGTGARYVSRAVSATAIPYARSTIIKAGTHDYVWIGDRGDAGGIRSATFDLNAGALIGESNATGNIYDLGGGWYRLELLYTRSSAGGTAGLELAFGTTTHSIDRPSFTFNGTETLEVFASEIGADDFITSPVLTSTSIETRPADTPNIATSEFDFSASENTFLFEGYTAIGTSTQVLLQFDNGTANERYRVERDSSNELHFIVTDGGVDQADLNFGVIAHNTKFKVAIRAEADDFAGSLNGGSVVTDSSGTLPTVSTFRLGHSNVGEQWSSAIFSGAVVPVGLANNALQAEATP